MGDVCHGRTVSQVVRSRADEYQGGDFLFNTNGWQLYGLTGRNIDVFGYMFPRRLDPAVAPISTAVGVLGMLGLTAYSGIAVQCRPQPGETVVVSAASGGVGQAAGQIAKLRGCRVVGIAGSTAKCDFVVEELGLDACVSHRSRTYPDDLNAACPDGRRRRIRATGRIRRRSTRCGALLAVSADGRSRRGGIRARQSERARVPIGREFLRRSMMVSVRFRIPAASLKIPSDLATAPWGQKSESSG